VGIGSRGDDLVGQAKIKDDSSDRVTGEKKENTPGFSLSSGIQFRPRASTYPLIRISDLFYEEIVERFY
jgi:hypothetical protein